MSLSRRILPPPQLIILDVGHGNSTIIIGQTGVVVIDCGEGRTLLDALENLGITEIDHVLFSHSDQDHIDGLQFLLSSATVSVRNIHINPDPEKTNKNRNYWENFLVALKDARIRGSIRLEPSLTVSTNPFDIGGVQVEVIAPIPELALRGTSAPDTRGRRITTNSLSAVVKVTYMSQPIALLPGDMTRDGYLNLLLENPDIEADILVFPHHGGGTESSNPQQFAKELCDRVKPNLVLFSIGRDSKRPKPEIIRGVKQSNPSSHILCTQLSKRCYLAAPSFLSSHFSNLPSNGNDGSSNDCCGGTLVVDLTSGSRSYTPSIQAHRNFVQTNIPTRLCT